MKKDCIFCKIVSGEVPAHIIYSDDSVISFLDINPVNIGHALVVPRSHYENMEKLPDDLARSIIVVAKRVGGCLRRSVDAEGYNLALNNGLVAGQVVNHVHMHIMPRFDNDGLKLWPKREVTEVELEKAAKKIRREIEGN